MRTAEELLCKMTAEEKIFAIGKGTVEHKIH